jgi:hypothetical protein
MAEQNEPSLDVTENSQLSKQSFLEKRPSLLKQNASASQRRR